MVYTQYSISQRRADRGSLNSTTVNKAHWLDEMSTLYGIDLDVLTSSLRCVLDMMLELAYGILRYDDRI